MSVEIDPSVAPAPRVRTRSPLVALAVIVSVLTWASAFVVIRYVGRTFAPDGLTLGRLAVGTVVLSLMMLVHRSYVRPTRREWVLIVITGLAWFALYSITLNAGERLVDAGTASMLVQLAPILIGILAGFALHEGFPRPLVVGGLIAFGGTLLIGIATSTGQASVVGVLLVLVAAVSYAVAMVAQKAVLRRLPALQVTWLGCGIGMVASLPFVGSLVHDATRAPLLATLGVVYLGAVASAVSFSTWAYALSHTDAGRLGVTTYLVPPIVIVLSWLLLGEVPALMAVLGGVISLLGVGISRRRTLSLRRPR